MSVEATEKIERSHEATTERPPLLSGDRLTRKEFRRRYRAYPEVKKAELIEGVVYVASPVRHSQHGKPHFLVITWLGVYAAATPGVDGSDNATVQLDNENEPQPDALLRLAPEHGGQSQVTPDDYIDGPPDLVVEVAASSAAYDLHDKKRAYARNGVREYLAIQVYEQRVDWWELREGVYEPLPSDEAGVIRSQVFPGLWLDTRALWQHDSAALLATLQQGLASEAHADFTDRLKGARDRRA